MNVAAEYKKEIKSFKAAANRVRAQVAALANGEADWRKVSFAVDRLGFKFREGVSSSNPAYAEVKAILEAIEAAEQDAREAAPKVRADKRRAEIEHLDEVRRERQRHYPY